MRIARILLGIVLVTVAVLAFLGGGAMWIAMQHESSDGGFGGTVGGLSSPGVAIVIPDVDALLRSSASLTGHSGTSVTVDAVASTGPAFVGLAPIAAIRAYLGPTAYARATALRAGLGGIAVTTAQVPGAVRPIPGGLPAKQGFWAAAGRDGRLQWSPSESKYDGLALVIMRADAAGPVTISARAEVKPEWLASTTWALFSVGTAVAIIAVVLLIWPLRRRDIVYVVDPSQLPEVAERLGMTIVRTATPDIEPTAAGSLPEQSRPTSAVLPADVLAAFTVHDAGGSNPFAALSAAARAAKRTPESERRVDAGSRVDAKSRVDAEPRVDAGSPVDAKSRDGAEPRVAPELRVESVPAWAAATPASSTPVPVPHGCGPRRTVPPVFADPLMRPHSLRTAALLDDDAAARRVPTRTNEPGTYRAFGTPPQVTPAFLWTTAAEDKK